MSCTKKVRLCLPNYSNTKEHKFNQKFIKLFEDNKIKYEICLPFEYFENQVVAKWHLNNPSFGEYEIKKLIASYKRRKGNCITCNI